MKYQIIAITNPHSSNAARVKKKVRRLEKKLGVEISCISSERDPLVFKKKFAKEIKKYDHKPTIVLIGGGDGTVHQVVKATIDSPEPQQKNTILLPVWGGNANDFAYMLNGMAVGKDLYKVITKGRVVKIHPLEIELKQKSSSTIAHAICYASFGASAFAADIIDKTGAARQGIFRNITAVVLIKEFMRVISAFVHAPPFKARINGKRVTIFEQVFTNGSRIAKIERLPVNLTDKAFYTVGHQPNKHQGILIRIIKILTGKRVGEVTSKPVSFQVKESILGQYDGEVIKIPDNTHVEIRVSEKYIYALSTRLKNN